MPLSYSVCTTRRPGLLPNVPAGLDELKWVPTSSILVSGFHDAVLVDVPLTTAKTQEVVDFVRSSGKNLKYVYITHPHGDHYFGLSVVLAAFPNARAIATSEAVKLMDAEIQREKDGDGFWHARFGNELPTELALPSALDADEFELEGETLQVIRTGHTDTDETSALWVSSIELVICGDAVYNGVYPYVGEGGTKALRDQWRAALDKIAALKPKFVVGGHYDPTKDHSPSAIEYTRQYLDALERVNPETKTVEEFYYKMLDLFPGRINPGSLWGAVNTLKKELA
jgi:glyoxylase-like metal-dependent hydrolase (beta-lactamase superfamily II)